MAASIIDVVIEKTDDPSTVNWVNPVDGATVQGTVTLQIEASDDRDTPTVNWKLDGGTQQPATYNP